MKKTYCILKAFLSSGMLLLLLAVQVFGACSVSEVDLLGSVRGRIVSTLDEEPQQGVAVSLSPGNSSTITGSDGYFEFSEIEPGLYSLQAQKADFKTNYKQVRVVAGQVAMGDMSLVPIPTSSSVEVSPESLDFGTLDTEATVNIRNTGDAGAVGWTVSGISVDWLKVTPQNGSTAQGMSSSIKVVVDRSVLSAKSTTYFTVNYAGGNTSVRVTASPAE